MVRISVIFMLALRGDDVGGRIVGQEGDVNGEEGAQAPRLLDARALSTTCTGAGCAQGFNPCSLHERGVFSVRSTGVSSHVFVETSQELVSFHVLAQFDNFNAV